MKPCTKCPHPEHDSPVGCTEETAPGVFCPCLHVSTIPRRRKAAAALATTPPMARATDPETSQQARVLGVRDYWRSVLTLLSEEDREMGWTADEVARELSLGACPWKRISECRSHGWISWTYNEDGSHVRRSAPTSGASATQAASRITPAGKVALEHMTRGLHPATVRDLATGEISVAWVGA